jgi:hypothetical protein
MPIAELTDLARPHGSTADLFARLYSSRWETPAGSFSD